MKYGWFWKDGVSAKRQKLSAIIIQSSNLRAMVKPLTSFWAAIAFYTQIPIPTSWTLEFQGVARWVTVMGLLIGGLLSLLDGGLAFLGVPTFTRSALVIVAWVGLTGGFHLDGAMDTADGLAVMNPERRLEVMADSVTGAFGAIASGVILLLKVAAFTDLDPTYRSFALIAAAGWGRWGQMLAILRYPYLKPTGKGAFHKEAIDSILHIMPSLASLLGLSGLWVWISPQQWPFAVAMALGGSAIAYLTGAWFNRQLGGHTGDTYGAVVEWTEALLLCCFTLV